MPTQYNQDAIEEARRLYCKFGGKNLEAVEREMQKKYPKWRKHLLLDRGKGKNERLGWITKYGFEKSLEIHLKTLMTAVADDTQNLYIGIKSVREALQLKVSGKDPSKDELYQYRDFCKLEIEARKALDLSRDNLETFVSGYEKLMIWTADIDPDLARGLAKIGDQLTELAKAHYGENETLDGGAGPDPDGIGEQPHPGEDTGGSGIRPIERALKLVEK